MRCKIIFLVVFLFSFIRGKAQQDTTQFYVKEFLPPDSIHKLWLGIEGGLEYCDRYFKTSDRYYASRTNFTNVGKRIPGSSFHLGVGTYYTLNHAWKIESGVHFLMNTYAISKYRQPFLTKSIVTGNDSILYKDIGFDYYQAYLYLPLYIKHMFYESQTISVYASGGTGMLILLIDADRNEYTNSYTPYQLTYNPLTITWHAGIGVFYKLSPDLLLKIEPGCRGTVTSPLKHPDGGSLFNAILSFGIIYTQ